MPDIWSNEFVRQHFAVDEVAARRRLQAALDLWATWKNPRSGRWSFSGEVLPERVRVRAFWQYEPAASVTLRGKIVPAPDGGSDFVGAIGVTRLERSVVVIAVLLGTGMIACLLVWLVTTVSGDHRIAHHFSWAPHEFGFLSISFSVFAFFYGRRRRLYADMTAAQALRNWLAELAIPDADETAGR